MNIGFFMCIILVPGFTVVGLLFAIFKEKSSNFVSRFNTLPEKEQALYDKAYIARDISKSCFIWTAIMAVGALGSLILTPCFAIVAYAVWVVLFLKDIHFDTHKAFEKYLLK